MLGTAVLLLTVAAFGVRFLAGRGNSMAPALVLPNAARPKYRLHLRYDGTGRELTATEEIDWVNPGAVPLEKLCLRVNAAAYANETSSPAAAADLQETAYPDGFDAAEFTLEGCWVDETLRAAAFDQSNPVILWIDSPVAPGGKAQIRLRIRLKVPVCMSLFGTSGNVVRLMQALPTIAAVRDGTWDTAVLAPYGAPQDIDLSDVQVTADLPEGYELATGADTGTNQLALLIVPSDMSRTYVRMGKTEIRIFADRSEQVDALAAAVRKTWPVFERIYGQLPLSRLTLVGLALTDSGYCAPGLVLLDDSLSGPELEQKLAYWLAGQWFGWAMGADNARDGWMTCAARQWAALRYARETAGTDAEANLRALYVDLPMRENLHAAVTPATPADGFPDLAAYRAVMDGRATAFYYALDTWMNGRFDAFLGSLVRGNAFTAVSRGLFLERLNRATGQDLGPLMTDWLDTYMQERP